MPEWAQAPAHWYWFIAGMVLLALEMAAPGAVLLWMGISALLVGGLVWLAPELGWEVQLLVYALLSIATVFLGRRYFRRHPIATDQPLLNRRGRQYVARRFTLAEPIVNGVGKITVDDTTWKVKGADCPAGSVVRVTGVDGVMLEVILDPPSQPAGGETHD